MHIERHILGMMDNNTYIIEENNQVLMVDPCGKLEKLEKLLKGRQLVGILITHGHFDHITGANALALKHNVNIYVSEKDEYLYADQYQFTRQGNDTLKDNIVLLDKAVFKIKDFNISYLETPGHTKGSVCFIIENHMFTGDMLFKGTIGRTDLPGSSNIQMKKSIELLKSLSEDYLVYPGHGDTSTLAQEKVNNYYFQ